MEDIAFIAAEYQQDQSLRNIRYRFSGSPDAGWKIERNGKLYLELGAGYVPVKTLACGICSTDLVRHRLPFPLPQITGHEVIGEYRQKPVAIEINASHAARGITDPGCVYCQNNLDSHCPQRMTLGIDRLPGGFSPWILAPAHAIHELPVNISPQAGVLIEPFAAAVRAVETSPPGTGDRVAVLGPRRLGMLIIAALDSYRKMHHTPFEIVAVMRHKPLLSTALELGADRVIHLTPDNSKDVHQKFDLVFDTTGSPAGFEQAMRMAVRVLHIKSTHGQAVTGLEHMTSMVINEQCLAGLNGQKRKRLMANRLDWPEKTRIYVSPALYDAGIAAQFDADCKIVTGLADDAAGERHLQQFELAVAATSEEIDLLTRPIGRQGQSLLRAKGSILLEPGAFKNHSSELLSRISQGQLELATSRCGRFSSVLDIFRRQPGLAERLESRLVSRIMPVGQLAEAMRLAARSDKSIKVVVETNKA